MLAHRVAELETLCMQHVQTAQKAPEKKEGSEATT